MAITRDTAENLGGLGAQVIAAGLRDAAAAGLAVFAVVGGRSVGGVFAGLLEANVPWDRVHVFLADERLVPLDSEESNFRLVRADLLDPLTRDGRLPETNLHPFRMDAAAPDGGAAGYTAELAALGARVDVALLSAGEDGHVASLFPRHPSVRDTTDGFVHVVDSPKPPPRRISASRPLLVRARLGVVLFLGEGKRHALDLFQDPTLGYEDCPAKLVEQMAAHHVLTDLT